MRQIQQQNPMEKQNENGMPMERNQMALYATETGLFCLLLYPGEFILSFIAIAMNSRD